MNLPALESFFSRYGHIVVLGLLAVHVSRAVVVNLRAKRAPEHAPEPVEWDWDWQGTEWEFEPGAWPKEWAFTRWYYREPAPKPAPDPAPTPETPPRRRLSLWSITEQSALVVAAFAYGLSLDAFSRQLVSPVYIVLGLAAGHLVFVLSLFSLHRSLLDAWSLFLDVGSIWRFVVDNPLVLSRYIGVAIYEEVIWRLAAQTGLILLTGRPWLSIIVVAVLFSVTHEHFFKNTFWVSVEFVAFALALGALYYWTGSLILVIVIHAVRDIEIPYIDYLAKAEEIGDAELARQEIEKTHLRVSLRKAALS